MDSLSEEQKFKILLEEKYRQEAAKLSYEPGTKSPLKKLWLFLNSSLGIWFLSTCIVGTAGLMVNNYKERQEKRDDQRRIQENADIEKKEKRLEDARRNASMVSALLPHLASNEEKEWRMAIAVTDYLKQNGELPLELESALVGIVSAGTSDKTSSDKAKTFAAVRIIDTSPTKNDDNVLSEITLPPRVYIQISSEGQRAVAKKLQSALNIDNFIAPGIENVGLKSPVQTEVRYFRDDEKNEAEEIAKIVSRELNLQVSAKKITIRNKNRPRHYEVWFNKV